MTDTETADVTEVRSSFLSSVKAVFQFFTILPLGENRDYEAYPRRLYLIPLAGLFTGCAGALCAYIFDALSMPYLACTLSLFTIMALYGFNHFDGVLDFGDGLMAHGSREKRIKALTDQNIGTGGTALGMFFIILTCAGLLSIPSYYLPLVIIAAELFAKYAQVLFLTYGTPLREGMFSYTHSFAKSWFGIAGLVCITPFIAAVFCLGHSLLFAAGACAGFVFAAAVLRHLSYYLFGGINGDITGTANEFTRLCVIIFAAVFLAAGTVL